MLSHAYKRKRNCAPRLNKQICIAVFLLLRYMRCFENNTAMVGTTQMQQKKEREDRQRPKCEKNTRPRQLAQISRWVHIMRHRHARCNFYLILMPLFANATATEEAPKTAKERRRERAGRAEVQRT